MWSDLIVGLDLPPAGEILLAGDDISDVDLPMGSGHRYDTGSMVLITRGEAPPESAGLPDTGLESDSLDLVILRDAAGSVTRLVASLLTARVRRSLQAALLEDKHDIESGGYAG